MKSLSFRLLAVSALTTLVALVATGLVLNFLFRSYFVDRFHQELEAYLVQLTANISFTPEGEFKVSEISDPRFSEPLSGFYWQVQLQDQAPVLSQSFWATPLDLPRPQSRGMLTYSSVSAESGKYLTASWIVTLSKDGVETEVFLVVAMDQGQFDETVTGFSINVLIWLGVLGAFLLLASWLQVRVGLKPLENVRSEVRHIKEGRSQRLAGEYPTEVMPLVDEVNDLLEHQTTSLARARARASTLAHGLKTPLTIMRAISAELNSGNRPNEATEIDTQVDNMQYFVERELARSRDQISELTWCHAAPVVEKIITAFKRSVSKADLVWEIEVMADVVCPFDEFALTELLGNLIDNAAKWTKTHIKVCVTGSRDRGMIEVTDDGPGISEASIEIVLARGERLDKSVPGQGLGLAIVNDMVCVRGARLKLYNREPNGLTARVSWG